MNTMQSWTTLGKLTTISGETVACTHIDWPPPMTESGPHITAAAERRLMTPEERMAEVARIRAERDAFIARNMTPHSEGIAKGQSK